ncbi:hypothetical protein FS749_007882 [Ceratobasidium sp. UAMH 11750]|nr:hypothetical protein FS749_007882 [Ceratobasidium sp. UAMH 11750]
MSLKLELETWAAALKAYDEEDFDKSLETFGRIAESSKILTNIGLIYATLGEHEAAVQHFREAVSLDKYLAVAYFQCGVSNFLLGHYDEALGDFGEALLYLRGNQAINYEQLGLNFRLYSAEVLFNKGLCQIYLNRLDVGLQDIREAQKAKVTEEHNVIDDAINDQGEGYTVFSIVRPPMPLFKRHLIPDLARRNPLPPLGVQTQKRENKRLSWQSPAHRRVRRQGRLYDFHRRHPSPTRAHTVGRTHYRRPTDPSALACCHRRGANVCCSAHRRAESGVAEERDDWAERSDAETWTFGESEHGCGFDAESDYVADAEPNLGDELGPGRRFEPEYECEW